MAESARHSKTLDSVIPLYVNLKELRPNGRPIDARLIEEFVLNSIREGSDRNVYEFLEKEFESGKVNGTWFFLFDSFDEIPEVLSATEVDDTVAAYADAITQFVEDMSTCRGVIASRYFRSPRSYGLPTFRIVPLSERRKRNLIRRADLGAAEAQLLLDMKGVTPDLSTLAANPLFLGLLVEYVRDVGKLPEGWHDVFEAFVSNRLHSDREQVTQLFEIEEGDLRILAEEIAFTMTATDGLGLSPRRNTLQRAFEESGFESSARLNVALDALQWIKLARSESGDASSTNPTFTFSHRRFQEYFATCVVLREPKRIGPRRLLTDASWRETAVTLCSARPSEIESLVAEAEMILAEAEATVQEAGERGEFAWPAGALHLLGLLQSAFAGRTERLPDALHVKIASLLVAADTLGTLTDRKWALEIAGTLPPQPMGALLLKAFRGRSVWLREVAYRQAARLSEIPDNLATEIRCTLIERASDLRREDAWSETKAQVLRLRPPTTYLRTARLAFLVIPGIDAAAFVTGFTFLVVELNPAPATFLFWALLALLGHLTYYWAARNFAKGRRSQLLILEPGPQSRLLVILLALTAVLHSSLFIPMLALTGVTVWCTAMIYLVSLEPPPAPLLWPVAPLRLAPRLLRTLQRSGVAAVAGRTGVAVLMISFVVVLTQLPKIVGEVLGIAAGVLSGFGLLFIFISFFRTIVRDALHLWRWDKAGHDAIDTKEFVTVIASLQTEASLVRFLRNVRTRRLLHADLEANKIVRDLLRLNTQPRNSDHLDLESGEMASWSEDRAKIASVLFPRWSRAMDELGQLLEDIEHEDAIPVA